MRVRLFPFVGALLAASLPAAVYAAPFSAGDLAVLRVGDGTVVSGANPVFIDEYTPTGTLIQSFAAPTTTTAGGNRITLGTSDNTQGQLTLSTNGQYLAFAGFDQSVGTTGGSSNGAFPNRVVSIVDANGVMDTSTVFSAGGTSPRSAITTDGTNIYIGFDTGSGTTGGVRYMTKGSTTNGTLVETATVTNIHMVNIYNGQLYASAGLASPNRGVMTVGTGLPTTGGQSITAIPGMSTTDSGTYDFAFADGGSTLYVADEITATAGANGLQKWTLSAGTWTKQYTIIAGLTSGITGLESLTVSSNGTNNVIYGVSGDGKLVGLTDTGSGATFTTIATPGANTIFRGVDFAPVAVPEPASLGLLASGGLLLLQRRRRAV